MNLSLSFTLLTGAEIYAPESLGCQDILLCQDRIVAMADQIDASLFPDCVSHDVSGCVICPGFIDQHVHLIGGGGEAGPQTRTPEAQLSTLVEAGITTVVGLLGTDSLTRHPDSLLAKVQALNYEGMTAYMLTGAYAVPSPTITDSVQKDVAFITPIIGVKTAISDHRSSAPSRDELSRLATQARVGGLLGAKAGVTVFHMGNSKSGLNPINAILQDSDVPINKLLPTHVNRKEELLAEAFEFAKRGGYIDLTTGINPALGANGAVKVSKAIKQALAQGVPLERITMSSDGQGSMPEFNAQGQLIGIGVAGFDGLLTEVQDMVNIEGLSLEVALRPLTTTVAEFLGLESGRLFPGGVADLLILDSKLQLQHVIAKGRWMVKEGRACVKGVFE